MSIAESNPQVTFINRCFWPDSEATGQLLTELCEFLAPRWSVSAVVGQPNWDTESEAFEQSGVQQRNGVSIHRLKHRHGPKARRFSRIQNLISFTMAVRRWGKSVVKSEALEHSSKNGSDRPVLVCETDPFLLPLVAGPIARRRNAHLIYYLQDIYPDVAVALGVTKNSFPIRILRDRLKKAYLNADCIVVLDEDMKERLANWGLPAEKMKIVPNWIDCSKIVPQKSNNSFRLEHQINNRFVVMHSGNMGLTQRLDVLVDSLSDSNFPSDAILMLVGNGAKKKEIEKYSFGKSNVRILPYQPKESLALSLSAADLHVISMDQAITGCLAPSKLYGILASGTPILAIVPKGNAIWRFVSEHKLGWTVEPGDTQGIARAIREAEATPAHELHEQGMRGRSLALQYFDKNICCDAFEKVLMDVRTGS